MNGNFHRENGPALIESNGAKSWWINGHIHRENGPALIWPDGREEWWLNGRRFTVPFSK
jgi:hypothetical protein